MDDVEIDGAIATPEVDALTGLVNRQGLIRQFEVRARSQPQALLLYLDIDGFGAINEHHGYAVGDQVLVELGVRLSSTLRSGDIACRYARDEFVAVCCAPWSDDAAVSTAMRIARELARPIAISHDDGGIGSLVVGVSMGIAVGATDQLSTLLAHADDNLGRAKQRRTGAAAPS